MSAVPGFTHLTLEDRLAIQEGLAAGHSKAAIAASLGKDKSTIGKELQAHCSREEEAPLSLECSHYPVCSQRDSCSASCPYYSPFHCVRRERSPGVCNGCPKYGTCPFNKVMYSAVQAQQAYDSLLRDSRSGANLQPDEARRIAEIVAPLLQKGTALSAVWDAHPELGISKRSLYNYIRNGTLIPYAPELAALASPAAGSASAGLRKRRSRKADSG